MTLPATREAWAHCDLYSKLPTTAVEWLYIHGNDQQSQRALLVLQDTRYLTIQPSMSVHLASVAADRMHRIRSDNATYQLEIPVLLRSIVAERKAGRISNTVWDMFQNDAVVLKLTARPAIGLGHPLPLEVTNWVCLPYLLELSSNYTMTAEQVLIDGQPVSVEKEVKPVFDLATRCYFSLRQPARDETSRLLLPAKALNGLAEGRHKVTVLIRLRCDPSEGSEQNTTGIDFVRALHADFQIQQTCTTSKVNPTESAESLLRDDLRIAASPERNVPFRLLIVKHNYHLDSTAEAGCFKVCLTDGDQCLSFDGPLMYRSDARPGEWELKSTVPLPANFRRDSAKILLIPDPSNLVWETVSEDEMHFGQIELPITVWP